MSDSKHLTVDELKKVKAECQIYISKLESNLNGQRQRLQCIEKYIFEKTPQELTIHQIEQKLGHKVIIK